MNKAPSRELIGSSNPIARFGRDMTQAVAGVLIGVLCLFGSFGLLWGSTHQVKYSKVIEALPLEQADAVVGRDGMVKIQAVPTWDGEPLMAPFTDETVLTYTKTVENYAMRELEKTRTVTEGGNDYKETYYEYKPSWETVETDTQWSDFNLGPIKIDPREAKTRFNETELYNKTEDQAFDRSKYPDDASMVGVVQKIRTIVKGVSSTDNIIVVGHVNGDRIGGGDNGAFFISNKSNEALLEAQILIEKVSFWMMFLGSWFLMALGFTLFFGPIIRVLNILPGLGSAVQMVLFLIFGVLSGIVVALGFIGIKFWWLILILGLLGIGFWMKKKHGQAPNAL